MSDDCRCDLRCAIPGRLYAYQRSLLDAFPNTSVLTVTPNAEALNLMRGMVDALQLSLQESEFQMRCDDILEDFCEVDFQLNRVPKWLTREVRRLCDRRRPAEHDCAGPMIFAFYSFKGGAAGR